MAALNTDKLKKLSRRWVGQIGAGGVNDNSTATIPLSSATNLATDTAVVAVIDRVDANGVATPSLEETVIGVVSGSNLVTSIRGVEGTAQAHSAGAVVEILVTAKGWNDLIDHLLVQHDQLGYHTNITASNINASATMTALNLTASHVSMCDVTALSYGGAGITAFQNSDGWISSSDTWTYASASTFTIAGVDRTTTFTKGTRLKFTQTTAKYAVVVSSSFSTNTTVTIAVNTDYTIANAAITSPYYSYQASPQGYPAYFSWTPTYTSQSGDYTNVPTTTYARYFINGGYITVIIRHVYNATSGGGGSSRSTLPVAPATSGTGCGMQDDNLYGISVLVDQANNRLTYAKADGASIIANSTINTLFATYDY